MRYILLFVLGLSLSAQDTTVKITGKGPQSSTSSVSVNYKNALVTYGIGNAVIDGSGVASLNFTIANKTSQFPAALQFDMSWTATDVSSVTFSIGAAASAAAKTITCNTLTANTARCVVAGGVTGISDGVVAIATVQTNLTSQATTSVLVYGAISASIGATPLRTTVLPGGGVISMPALLVTMTCAQPDIWTGLTVTCSAALNKPAPTGGISVALASDSNQVTVPLSVQILAGAKTGTFNITGL